MEWDPIATNLHVMTQLRREGWTDLFISDARRPKTLMFLHNVLPVANRILLNRKNEGKKWHPRNKMRSPGPNRNLSSLMLR